MGIKQYYSLPEIAALLGVSRIYIYSLVKKGKIKAIKVGRNYAVAQSDIDVIQGKQLSREEKDMVAASVAGTVSEYGETLRKLGNE